MNKLVFLMLIFYAILGCKSVDQSEIIENDRETRSLSISGVDQSQDNLLHDEPKNEVAPKEYSLLHDKLLHVHEYLQMETGRDWEDFEFKESFVELLRGENIDAGSINREIDISLEGENIEVEAIKREVDITLKTRWQKIDLREKIVEGPVEVISDEVVALGPGWNFYRVEYETQTSNYAIQFDAKLDYQDGYGFWFRGQYHGSSVNAFGVQYLMGGIGFPKYPQTERDFYTPVPSITDNNWHHFVLFGHENCVKLYLDGQCIFDRPDVSAQGNEFGFRTWRGRIQIREFKICEDKDFLMNFNID